MPLPAQDKRTFFITTVTWERRSLFRVERNTELLIEIMQNHRRQNKYEVHAFVIMPDHLHLLLTPAADIALEKAMQLMKGGFSFQSKIKSEIWQRSFTEHRVKRAEDYRMYLVYIEENPVRARLADTPSLYKYSSASGNYEVDPIPQHFAGQG